MFVAAARKLTNEAASTYVRLRLAADPTSIGVARLEAYSLVNRDGVMDAVNAHASTRIDALRAEHGAAIARLSAARQARYRAILRQVPAPSLVPLKLPEVAIFRKGDASARQSRLRRGRRGAHLPQRLGDGQHGPGDHQGHARSAGCAMASARAGSACPGATATSGAGSSRTSSSCARMASGWSWTSSTRTTTRSPTRSARRRVCRTTPRKHAEQLGHVDLVAKIGTRYRRLHLDQLAIRNKVDALDELRANCSAYTGATDRQLREL